MNDIVARRKALHRELFPGGIPTVLVPAAHDITGNDGGHRF